MSNYKCDLYVCVLSHLEKNMLSEQSTSDQIIYSQWAVKEIPAHNLNSFISEWLHWFRLAIDLCQNYVGVNLSTLIL